MMGIGEYLRSQHVPFEAFLHAPAPSATRRAQSVHVAGQRVAKGVLVQSGTGYVLAVLPATHRIDLAKLAGILGTTAVQIAGEDEVERVFHDCERGALPPFGRLYGLPTVVDASLSGGAQIVIEGNARHEGLRLRYRDYEAVESPTRARFAEPITPRRKRP